MNPPGLFEGVDPRRYIIVRGARQHNLKNISLNLPKYQINVITGPSGSGKSSLAFNTIFAEGQRRYMESLSAYARQFLVRMDKPDVDYLGGLAPAIAIEQKALSRNPRSTVATQTEIYDHLRLLYAQIGTTISPVSREPVIRDSPRSASIALTQHWEEGARFYLAFDLPGDESLDSLRQRGYSRLLTLPESGAANVIHLDDIDAPPQDMALYVLQDRLVIRKGDDANITRIADSVQHAYAENGGRCIAVQAKNGGEFLAFSEHFERDGMTFEEPTARLFSFNSPMGACPECEGLGRTKSIDPSRVIPDPDLSLQQGAIAPYMVSKPGWAKHQRNLLLAAYRKGLDVTLPYKHLPEDDKEFVWEGDNDYEGIRGFFRQLRRKAFLERDRTFIRGYEGFATCKECLGSRLRHEARFVEVGGLHIAQVLELTTKSALEFFEALQLTQYQEAVASALLSEIRKRLRFLVEVGLGYVTLDRSSTTLSGGESQRICLASSIGSSLVGSLYVLDEPTIGLHPRDTLRLVGLLRRLRDLGNTVLVVEHDAEVMRHADMIVDLGPESGNKGGAVICQGSYEEILKCDASLTGAYLSQRKHIPAPAKRRAPDWSKAIAVRRARAHNLKRITATFPLGLITVVTGVSGSGKSTLVHDTLYLGLKQLKGLPIGVQRVGAHDSILGHALVDRVEMVDQSPIGRSSRSNAATYTGAFGGIRQLFAGTFQAKMRGYPPGYFSFNVDGGRCEECKGDGSVRIEMQFLADLYLECEECRGQRFKDEVLDVEYNGKNIHDALNLTINEALDFFKETRAVANKLSILSEIGLGYLKLGQSAPTLSGGEAQRLKLAAHLGTRTDEHILYVFDEPTTGLHFDDIRKLLLAFNRLANLGHTIIVIEHNMDVIKAADWVIDLGPEGGFAGGAIVAEGTPESVATHQTSHTGRYLRREVGFDLPGGPVTLSAQAAALVC